MVAMRYRYAVLALSVVSIAAVLLYWQGRVRAGTSTEVAPYTAHLTITRHVITSNGSRRDAVTTDVLARDRQGRTYEKTQRVLQNVDRRVESFSFFVQDPVKLRTLTWDSIGKTVVVGQWPYWAGRKGCWVDEHGQHQVSFPTDEDWHKVPASPGDGELETVATIAGHSGKQIKARFVSENLGHKEIHGLAAYGMRWTTVPVGNDATPAVRAITTELWKSNEFNLKILEVESGAQFGVKRLELSDLQRGDPEPELFEPPSGYTVETIDYHQVPCVQK